MSSLFFPGKWMTYALVALLGLDDGKVMEHGGNILNN
jgi:hypothetical protein